MTKLRTESSKFRACKVRGTSMEPLFPDGSWMVFLTSPVDFHVGDIVVFSDKTGNLCAHRTILKKKSMIRTKGDNSVFLDKPIHSNRIEGKVILSTDMERKFWKVSSIPGKRMRSFRAIFRKLLLFSLRFQWMRASRFSQYPLTELGFRRRSRTIMVYERFESQKLGRDLIVYDHETGNLHTLNETAALVWKLIQEDKQEQEIVSEICTIYDTEDREQVTKDVTTVIEDLRKIDLINSEKNDPQPAN